MKLFHECMNGCNTRTSTSIPAKAKSATRWEPSLINRVEDESLDMKFQERTTQK